MPYASSFFVGATFDVCLTTCWAQASCAAIAFVPNYLGTAFSGCVTLNTTYVLPRLSGE